MSQCNYISQELFKSEQENMSTSVPTSISNVQLHHVAFKCTAQLWVDVYLPTIRKKNSKYKISIFTEPLYAVNLILQDTCNKLF